jgi:hypothetical protein
MSLQSRIAEWREELCAGACPVCPQNCCAGRLNPRIDSLEAFADLPRVRGPLDPRPREGPYLVDRRVLKRWGACYLVGRCPHLTEENRCDIYGQPPRPRECREYPLHLQKTVGGTVLNAETSCWIFQSEENREAARMLARDLGVGIEFH